MFTTIDNLITHLKKLGYKDLKKKDSRSVFVLTNNKRSDVFNKLINQLGGRKNPVTNFGGSMGHIDIGTFRVAVKPLSKQGLSSAGVDNELNLVSAINFVIKTYGVCDVKFTDGSVNFLANDIKEARRVGEDTAGRKKADLNLYGVNGKVFPVSLKKDNAEYWESADSYWKANAEFYLVQSIKNSKVTVQSIPGNIVKINPSIGVEATDEEAKDAIFGSDISGKGCVVTKTFDGSEFNYDGNKNLLTITVLSVITKLADVPDTKKVWFLIRNDSTRKSIPSYPGTRALATYKSRITSSVYQIPKTKR